MRRSTTGAAAASAVLLALLAGCGDDSDGGGSEAGDTASTESTSPESALDDYCALLDDTRGEFENFGGAAAFDRLGELQAALEDVAAVAPDEIADDWDVLLAGFEEVEATLDEVGITPQQLEELQQGQLPEGVDPDELRAAFTELEANTQEVQPANDAISAHAKDECGITLEEGGAAEPTEEPTE